jgi:hypothetical protein
LPFRRPRPPASLAPSGGQAPLRELDDCFNSLYDECEIIGNGCEGMGSLPNCRRTVVQLGSPQSPGWPQFPVKW